MLHCVGALVLRSISFVRLYVCSYINPGDDSHNRERLHCTPESKMNTIATTLESICLTPRPHSIEAQPRIQRSMKHDVRRHHNHDTAAECSPSDTVPRTHASEPLILHALHHWTTVAFFRRRLASVGTHSRWPLRAYSLSALLVMRRQHGAVWNGVQGLAFGAAWKTRGQGT